MTEKSAGTAYSAWSTTSNKYHADRPMKPWLKTTVIFATTILIVWSIRSLAFLPILITAAYEQPSLLPGDRVIVDRCSFGLRLPGEFLFGYHRLSPALPRRGDPIAFNDPIGRRQGISARPLCIGTCTALPGDTIWLPWNPGDTLKNTQQTRRYPFVIPGKNVAVDIHPWNIVMLANALHLYEQKNVCWDCDSLLVVDGKPVRKATFSDNYLWVTGSKNAQAYDSRLFGLLPASHLIGKPVLLLYSKDPEQPFYSGYRFGRFLIPLS